jgi:hypothetical protein
MEEREFMTSFRISASMQESARKQVLFQAFKAAAKNRDDRGRVNDAPSIKAADIGVGMASRNYVSKGQAIWACDDNFRPLSLP